MRISAKLRKKTYGAVSVDNLMDRSFEEFGTNARVDSEVSSKRWMARLRDGLDLFSKMFCSGAVLFLIEINASTEASRSRFSPSACFFSFLLGPKDSDLNNRSDLCITSEYSLSI